MYSRPRAEILPPLQAEPRPPQVGASPKAGEQLKAARTRVEEPPRAEARPKAGVRPSDPAPTASRLGEPILRRPRVDDGRPDPGRPATRQQGGTGGSGGPGAPDLRLARRRHPPGRFRR